MDDLVGIMSRAGADRVAGEYGVSAGVDATVIAWATKRYMAHPTPWPRCRTVQIAPDFHIFVKGGDGGTVTISIDGPDSALDLLRARTARRLGIPRRELALSTAAA